MKKYLLIFALVSIPLFGYLFWHTSTPTLITNLSQYQKAGEQVKASLSSLPALPIQEEDERYTIEDTTKEGIQITYANQSDNTALAAEPKEETKPSLTLHFPKQYAKEPIEVQIAEGKSILIQDKTAKGDYTSQSLSLGSPASKSEINEDKSSKNPISWLQSLLGSPASKLGEEGREYLSYTDSTKRITTYYAYGHDQATGEKQLKNWQVYNTPGIMKGEQVAYSFTNAKLRKNEDGQIEVYYYGDQELRNDKASAQVDPSLMARAQRTLAKDMGDSIDAGQATPNFIIPKPYYINATGEQRNLDWRLSMDGRDISIDFTPEASEYPLALDPTLSFTAPGMSNTGDVITGEAGSSFGEKMTTGDFNSDGKMDLAIGTSQYGGQDGRVYIFYNDGTISSRASGADVTIDGESASGLGSSLAAGDFNADGRTDLVVGAIYYSSSTGRAYIFYNDGTYPVTAASADISITGGASYFGNSLTAGDFNADGRTDLAVAGYGYSSFTGRAYIFYNDGSIPTTAGTADVTITGETTVNSFGFSLASGDFNADGKTDLAVGAYRYSTQTGRAYIFYNDGSIPTTAATADVTITGEATSNSFGISLTAGDLNADGRTDLAVGAHGYSTNTGRAYIFYNDGSIPTTAATADVTITGEGTNNYLGYAMVAGDFNADGRTDLAMGAYQYSSYTGRTYIFYNDGSIPTTAATADVIITGEGTSNYFGHALTAGDFNSDGKTDLAVGAYNYASATGRAYIFYSQNGQVNTNQNITGDASGDYFGRAMATGDFNADGRLDLAVGAPNYSTNTGRVYLFYGDGQIPTTAASADVTITGEATNNYFGYALTAGDLNADGETDLAVGAYGYSTDTGRAYIFYNDGSIPTTAATADVVITGGGTGNSFGDALTVGDFNSDGRTDLAVAASGYASATGRAYIFYNDGSIPTTAATADVIITGAAGNNFFGTSLISGDFNGDGRVDIAVGAYWVSSYAGYVYIFYNDGSIPTTAATADVSISGEGAFYYFGVAMTTGDFNSDGRTDLVVGSLADRAYIFYNDGSIPTASASADIIITGQGGSSYFGRFLTSGDFNADGNTDLAVGASGYSTNTGRAYIFYNDGSIPTTAVTADVILTGETTSNYYGRAFATGDFNADGRTDLIVGAYGYSTNTGRVYFYETHENFAWKLQSLSPDTGGLRTGLSGTGQEMKITGNAASDQFGYAMTTGDFNSDGKTDLAVGARGYSTNTGRAYIFYGDGSLSAGATGADVVITGGATNNYFGNSLVAGDWNADGRIDLAVGASGYNSDTGRAYIFYNDGSIPTTAATADVIITGESGSSYFSNAFIVDDFNADGKMDLVVGAHGYSSSTGRAYIFYNDGSIPTTAATADVTITGESTNNYFGISLTAGDFNTDGRVDLTIGAAGYSSSTGRAYIFYNDGSIPTTAATADVTITGGTFSNYFGYSLATGDLNTDGKTDLAVGAYLYSSDTGRAYIFYNDGSIPTTAGTADVTITGEGGRFGVALVAGDLNTDGRTDLAVSAPNYSTNTGRAYIFYNDGSIPTTAATADVTLTGEATSNVFGSAMTAGDLNADGKTDLVVGAYGYSGSKGRAYIYTFNDPVITGETTSNNFGTRLILGDFNADGKIDLAVSAPGYSTNTGRVYIFYQDGTIPSTAASADVIITGETTGNYFGDSLVVGDFNSDGRNDLAIGAYGYSTYTGRAYIFYNDGVSFGTVVCTTGCLASNADIVITGSASYDYFGTGLTSGDLNSDGREDFVAQSMGYSASTGRIGIFYNDGSIPTTAATADVIITGETTNNFFGTSPAVGDFNADGRIDLAVSAHGYSTNTGRVYIFYDDGSIPTTAATADVIITGETTNNYFGGNLTVGDWNSDGKTDLAIGADSYSTNTGRSYIFYNDGSIPTTAATADVIITGETTNNNFGGFLTAGDFNSDGKTDLVVGARAYSTNTGRAYIFYNDSSIPTTAATADAILTGESGSNFFGYALTAGDWNADGKIDLAVGAYGYSTSTGRVYLFTSEAAPTNPPTTLRMRGPVRLHGSMRAG